MVNMASKELSNVVIKIFENTGIADGGKFSDKWDSDDNYILRHIFIKADGAKTTKSTITIRIRNEAITKDKALCNTFGTNAEDALLLNIRLNRSDTFEYEGTNAEGATKDFTVELVMEKVG